MWKAIGTAISKNWNNIPAWGRNTLKWGGGLLGLGGGTALVTGVGGSTIKTIAERPIQGSAELAAGGGVQQTKSTFFGMVGFFAEILKALGVGGGIPEALMKFANRGHALGGGNPIHHESRWNADDARFGGQGLGPNGMGGPGNDGGGFPWGPTLLGAGAGAGLGGAAYIGNRFFKGGAAAASPGVVAGAADDVARAASATSRFSGLLSRLPVIGKYLGAGAIIGGAGAALLGAGDAEAATLPTAGSTASPAATAAAAEIGTVHAAAAEVSGLGLGIVGARTAAQGVAPVAAGLTARLGMRAIPGIASIVAAGDAIYNTTSHALKGEWSKAGLSLVSGVGETVAGLGGALGYATVGTAWREAVRGVGALAFGEENTIDHSLVVQGAGLLRDAFGNAHDNRRAAPAAAPVFAPQPGLAFGS